MAKFCSECGQPDGRFDHDETGWTVCHTCQEEAKAEQAYLEAEDRALAEKLERDSWPEPCECVHDMPGHHPCCPHHVSRR